MSRCIEPNAAALALVESWAQERGLFGLSTKALHVLLSLYALCLYSLRDKGIATCNPSRRTLGQWVGKSEDCVKRLLQRFRTHGLILTRQYHRLLPGGAWYHSTNLYTMLGFTEERRYQLAALLGVKLPPRPSARMLLPQIPDQKEEEEEACGRAPERPVPVEVARRLWEGLREELAAKKPPDGGGQRTLSRLTSGSGGDKVTPAPAGQPGAAGPHAQDVGAVFPRRAQNLGALV
jgi:hypothetical protein